ncbi:aminodeoxychorismate synthase component I [Granulicella sp. L60]|uniref:aminodeoxychorismate synthase component I n=1 Tax=Granulicella sp. L60 TaxID=1641866 RepID=UPI00131C1F3C|nr:aminodeoxychorismate synthase component I [Granulicella sp. L60]
MPNPTPTPPHQARAAAAENPNSILLETSRFDPTNQQSYLFLHPTRILTANYLHEIPQLFTDIDAALAEGSHVAGYCSYECSYHFEPIEQNPHITSPSQLPLAWFGVYPQPTIFDHIESPAEPTTALADHLALNIPEDEYIAKILKIKDYIASGDTYQVNFTDEVSFRTSLSPLAVFSALSQQQPVAYSALLNIANHHILSFSPELFFKIDQNKIITRPMKGTMPRGLDINEDAQMSARLRHDEKNRSEHIMIVDLLRNDLGRICTMGSVHVNDLFSVERYQTLLQMTSTVSGLLRPNITHYEIFRSIFPSGSITGAPKIRTMQIIRELEQRPRGIYTGAIGFFSPSGTATFNVAIRTLILKDGIARMGVGGGIVADSDPHEEHRECLLKASFLTRAPRNFQLIETMLLQGELRLLPMHLDRLESSALYFNFPFDRSSIQSRLHSLTQTLDPNAAHRVRLLLDSTGNLTLTTEPFHPDPSPITIKLSPEPTSSTDPFFRHKTTHRQLYDREYAAARAANFDEVLFTNERGELTEGAISNLFIERAGKLFTPPLICGVLPGIFRRHLIETNPNTEENILTTADLQTADAIFLCNSLRGLRRVKSIDTATIKPDAATINPAAR